ncbi:hypothetical protein [Nocardia donostiensis]|uniref:ABC transmembrane type-1 domain-containing protein n=1 Tax=Nocardia donostiensis TaxID=1538463 RepID=A0A1W0BBD0_9NOCA|nr:hypothetical protein [Nocardia donostiensis]ONM49722.1 hypothetical protein B0T46_04685 [Nocardia donostiensis]OQS15396.1 hypothetical protein B0T36_08890 [Nocardia donostiensis]OQS19815.1 hypothetical protein B0T44_12355 [Nocardia donostiensis]
MTHPPDFRAHGLRIELATRRIRGPLVSGRPPRRGLGWPACLPAAALLALLVVPAGWTVILAVRTRPDIAGWCLGVAVAAVALVRLTRRLLPDREPGSAPGQATGPTPGSASVTVRGHAGVSAPEPSQSSAQAPAPVPTSNRAPGSGNGHAASGSAVVSGDTSGADSAADRAANAATGPVSDSARADGDPPQRDARIPELRATFQAEHPPLRPDRTPVAGQRTHSDSRWELPRPLLGVLLFIGAAMAALSVWGLGRALGPGSGWSYLRTLVWVVFALVLLVGALLLAWFSRSARWLWLPLIVPFGVSAFVSGVAFRLSFQYIGPLWGTGVTAYRWWFVFLLGSAFLWTWLGFLTCLFRAGIAAIQADPVRGWYLHNGEGWLLWRLFLLLRPIVLVAGLIVAVAAARVFDVVLIGVPGAMQYQLDSATVHWWRLVTDPDLPAGQAAAYSLPLAVLVGVLAWVLQTGLRRYPIWMLPTTIDHLYTRRSPRFQLSAVRLVRAIGIGAVWTLALLPVAVLGYAAVRNPQGPAIAAFSGTWGDRALMRSLLATGLVAALVTFVVIVAAAPLAYRLAAPRTAPVFARAVVIVLVVFAVLPVQSYMGPLDALIDDYGLSGTRIPLILVHAAAGLPIAILILRGAILAPPGSSATDALHGLAAPGAVAGRLLVSAGPSLGAVAVLEFVQVWNDFVIGLLVSGAGASPWSLLLWGEARQFGENTAQLAAGSLLAAVVPVTLVLLTWRRWLLPGLTGGVLR